MKVIRIWDTNSIGFSSFLVVISITPAAAFRSIYIEEDGIF